MTNNIFFQNDEKIQSLLEVFCGLFGINNEYAALVDLLDTLKSYSSFVTQSDIPSIEDVIEWEQLDTLSSHLQQKGKLPRGAVGSDANAAGGSFTKFPLPAAFLANASADSKSRYEGLRLVLLVYVTVIKSTATTRKSLCDDIRFSSDELNEQNEILQNLPEFTVDSIANYYANLCLAIKVLEKDKSNYSSDNQRLIAHLSRLIDLPRPKRKRRNSGSVTLIALPEDLPIPISGALSIVNEFVDDSYDEAPTYQVIYEDEQPISADIISEEVFSFSAKQARYWLERNESLSEINSSRLNPIEKRMLADYIQTTCISNDFDGSLPGVLIALVYLTGLDLQRVLKTTFGTTGFINSNAQLIKTLPPTPVAYRDENIYGADDNIIQLSLPSCIQAWMKTHQQYLNQSDTFLLSSKLSADKLIEQVKNELEQLREGGRYRIKLQRLQSCLASELTVLFRDPVFTSILAGDFTTQPPVLMYYRAVMPDELAIAFEKTTNSLLVQQPTDLLLGSQLSGPVLPYRISAFIKSISDQTAKAIRNYPADIISTHNIITHYTVAMLSFALGHRPVVDPHCYFNDINLDLIASLISDKVVDPRHEYRYQPLPEIARDQIKGYFWHLKRLAHLLIKKKTVDTKPLGQSILNMLRGEPQPLPLFFIIDELELTTKSLTPKLMDDYWQSHGDLALNAGRSVVATELIKMGISAPVVEIFLGHFHGLNHPWGDRSSRIPASDVVLISNKVNDIFKKIGWQVIVPPLPVRDRLKLTHRLTKKLVPVLGGSVLGPVKREQSRKKRVTKVKLLIREVVNTFFSEQTQTQFTSSEFGEIRKAVIEKADTHRLSQQECLFFLNRWITKKIAQGIQVDGFKRIRPIKVEQSPINRPVFTALGKLQHIRSELTAYTACNSDQSSLTITNVLAELTLRASCFGGLSNPEFIQQLPQMVLKNSYQINGDVFIEYDKFRWYPDPSSLCLMIYIQKVKDEIDLDSISEGDVLQGIRTLLAKFDIKVSKKSVYTHLAGLADACQKLHLPGFLRTAWSKEYPSSNLKLNTYFRLLTNKQVQQSEEEMIENVSIRQDYWLPNHILSDEQNTQLDAKIIWHDLQYIISDVNDAAPKGVTLSPEAKRNQLSKRVKNYVESNPQLTPIAIAIAAWIVERCQKGISGGKVKVSSIQRYLQALARPLLYLIGNENWGEFTSEDFDELYIQVLDWGNNVGKPYRIRRLFDFHHFITKAYMVEKPDWSMLFALAGEDAPSHDIDANILTVSEYDTALELIKQDASLSDWLKSKYAMLLILGFRFGLRFGEAMRLQWRDVQQGANQTIILQIHNSIFGVTKSSASVRQVPLLGHFSENEQHIFDKVMQQAEAWFTEDIQVVLMFEGQPRRLIERDKAAQYLNTLLKHVSCDPSLRFHHLRHTWVTRAIASAYPLPSVSFWSKVRAALIGRLGESNSALLWGKGGELSQKLQAISDSAGHATIQTTLSSYFHVSDVLGAAYLAQQKIEMPTKVLSMMLNTSEPAIYKRKSRSSNESVIQNALATEKVHTLFSDPLSTVTTIKKLPRWPTVDIAVVEEALSLQMIDRLLLLVSRRQGEATKLADSIGIPQDKIDKILLRAIQIELDSGFDFYKTFWVSNDGFIKKPVTTTSKENVLESKRLSVLFKIVEPHSNEQMALAITAWNTAYRQKKNEWQFSSRLELFNFLDGLNTLGLADALFELRIPQTIAVSQDLIDQLPIQCQITITEDRPNLTERAIKQYITLIVKELPIEWKTFHTVNRMLFCIAVRIAVSSENL